MQPDDVERRNTHTFVACHLTHILYVSPVTGTNALEPRQAKNIPKTPTIKLKIPVHSLHLQGDSPRNLTLCFSFKHGRIFNVGGK